MLRLQFFQEVYLGFPKFQIFASPTPPFSDISNKLKITTSHLQHSIIVIT